MKFHSTSKKFTIPPDASVEEVIRLLNLMGLQVDTESRDPETHIWINEHKDWFDIEVE